MAAFLNDDEGKGLQSLRNGPYLNSSRLGKHVDHFEREKLAILHQVEKQKHMYRKSLEQLQERRSTTSSPLIRVQASSGHSSFPNSPLMAASGRSNQANGRGSEQLRGKGLSKSMGHASSPAPFSRYVSNDKLLGGSKVQARLKISGEYPPKLSRTPDVNAGRRREAMNAGSSHSPDGLRRDRGAALFLSPNDSLRRSVSDRNIYTSSIEPEIIDLKPPVTKEEIRARSPGIRRRSSGTGTGTSASELTTLLDMLPSINSQPQLKSERKDVESEDTTDGEPLPANHGMSNRLAHAVREIETRLADHKLKLEDTSTKRKEPERPTNVLLPDKTRKYHTFMTLPPTIPIPWHLYGADSDDSDSDDNKTANAEKTEKERKRSASFDATVSEVEKSPLAQQFEEMKHCRYLRQYKPTVTVQKRESWF